MKLFFANRELLKSNLKRLPKVGSTQLSVYLWSLHDNDTSKMDVAFDAHAGGIWVHDKLLKNEITDKIRPLHTYSKEEQHHLIENVSGVLVVRDPLDRIVSAWRDKFGPVEDATNLQIKTSFFVRFHFESFY